MLNRKKAAVISSGNGGQSLAAYLAFLGCSTSLYAREEERAAMFPQDGVFKLRGVVEADPVVECVSHQMGEVIHDAALIMVTTPSQYHPVVARAMAPHLVDGQVVVLNPGRSFGTHVFLNTLQTAGCAADVVVAEAETFLFACRCVEVAEPVIYGIKRHVRVAAHHPEQTGAVLQLLESVLPGVFQAASSTLHTSFANIGMLFHPLPVLLNITRVEKKETFRHYADGITPLAAGIIEKLDMERLAVAKAYGVDVQSAFDWLGEQYGSQGDSLYQRIQNNPSYQGIVAPTDVNTRYVLEDVPTGCVPIYCAGRAAGVETPTLLSLIQWASSIYGVDFLALGRGDAVIDFETMLCQAGTVHVSA